METPYIFAGVITMPTTKPVAGMTRKAQMFAAIVDHLVLTGDAPPIEGLNRPMQAFAYVAVQLTRTGRSPSLGEIARHLGVAKSRAGQLIAALRHAGVVQQVPGAQRALTIPGLERRLAIEHLRREGFVIDEDIMRVGPSTPVQLPIVAVIEHRRRDDPNQPAA